ncbi:hypothetical protein J2Z63_000096 [Mycoplasma yeatsii]|uniref:Ion transport domain-containing protein n=2 Tax=Mycoplasma yeatsii TaxID=51365 RepID=A0ABU0NDF7_9MOLU|nr:hypothetical protein [Mycoplasma yeatsii]
MFFTILNYFLLIPIYLITFFVMFRIVLKNISRKHVDTLCVDFYQKHIDLNNVRKRVLWLSFKLWFYLFVAIMFVLALNVVLDTGVFNFKFRLNHSWIRSITYIIFEFLFRTSISDQAYKNPFFIFFCIFVISCIILAIFSFIKLLPTKSEKKILLEHWEKWKTLYSNSEYKQINMKFQSSSDFKKPKGEPDKLKEQQLKIKGIFTNKNISELKCAYSFLNYLEKSWDLISDADLYNAINLLENNSVVIIDEKECSDYDQIIETLISNYFYLYFKNKNNN